MKRGSQLFTYCCHLYLAWLATLHTLLLFVLKYEARLASLHTLLLFVLKYEARLASLHTLLLFVLKYEAWLATLHTLLSFVLVTTLHTLSSFVLVARKVFTARRAGRIWNSATREGEDMHREIREEFC